LRNDQWRDAVGNDCPVVTIEGVYGDGSGPTNEGYGAVYQETR